MNNYVFIFSMIFLQLVCWWGSRCSMRKIKDQQDYFLGGRRVSFLPLMATFLATQVGGGIVLGSAQEAMSVGWWVLFYPLGQVLGLILLGCGIGKKLASFQVSTIAQIFEVAYDSPALKRIASFLSIISLLMILIGQILATRQFLLAIGIDDVWLFALIWGVLIAYTSLGGMKAVIATDLIQSFFFIAIFILAFAVAFFSDSNPSVVNSFHSTLEFKKFSGWFLLPLLFTFIEQDMGQRCFSASSSSILKKAAIGAGLAAFSICMIPVYFGMLGNQLTIEGEGSILMRSVALSTNPTISALVGVAILAAVLSTANSLINAIGANLSQDFFQNKKSMNFARWISFFIAIAAIFFSFCFGSVVDVLMLSYELSISALFIPLMGALFFKKRKSVLAASFSMMMGSMGFFLFHSIDMSFPKELATLGCSFVGFFVGEAFSYVNKKRVLRSLVSGISLTSKDR